MRATTHTATPGSARADEKLPADAVWWTFPPLPIHARQARKWLEAWLDDEGPGKDEQVHAALVAFSELVTNAVLHGCGPITVHAGLAGRQLRCEVTDRCVELPRLLDPARAEGRHRGLSLIESLTQTWWVRAAPGGGKTIGFTVELDAS